MKSFAIFASMMIVSSIALANSFYQGLCDASAAVYIGGDKFAVAEDESNQLFIYKIGEPQPIHWQDFTNDLGARKDNGGFHEVDLEGATAIGDKIYWIGSHANKSSGHSVPHRHRLFATTLNLTKLPVTQPFITVGISYEKFLEELVSTQEYRSFFSGASGPPEGDTGINIEGLSSSPLGALLIGFRNPRPGGRALIATLTNPTAVISGTEKPKFAGPKLLDLGGRGIRSMEWVDNTYWIVAGPHNDVDSSAIKPPFALYRWNGEEKSAPIIFDSSAMESLRPEAMFYVPERNALFLLSDDGDQSMPTEIPGQRRACKKNHKDNGYKPGPLPTGFRSTVIEFQ